LEHSQRGTLAVKQVLYRQGDRIAHVYFPNGGVWSVTTMALTVPRDLR
jgi:hypothetical protein